MGSPAPGCHDFISCFHPFKAHGRDQSLHFPACRADLHPNIPAQFIRHRADDHTRRPSLSPSDVPPAQQRLVLCKVPCMSGIPSAAKAFLAFHASGTIRCPVPPESLKSVLPHLQKIICPDVSLNQFFSVFNIQACADIAIAPHTGCQNSGAAQKIMIPGPFAHSPVPDNANSRT